MNIKKRGEAMLTFKLISFVDGFYHYEIYPEGKIRNKGWFIFNQKEGISKEKLLLLMELQLARNVFERIKDKNGNYKSLNGSVVLVKH